MSERRNRGEEMAMYIALFLFSMLLLAWSFIADEKRDKTKDIDPEVWEQFQKCIDTYPSDAVCDSCWKAIIEPSFKPKK